VFNGGVDDLRSLSVDPVCDMFDCPGLPVDSKSNKAICKRIKSLIDIPAITGEGALEGFRPATRFKSVLITWNTHAIRALTL
jgi:hypothetical protein